MAEGDDDIRLLLAKPTRNIKGEMTTVSGGEGQDKLTLQYPVQHDKERLGLTDEEMAERYNLHTQGVSDYKIEKTLDQELILTNKKTGHKLFVGKDIEVIEFAKANYKAEPPFREAGKGNNKETYTYKDLLKMAKPVGSEPDPVISDDDTDRVRNNRDNDTDRVRNNRDNDTDRVRNNRDNDTDRVRNNRDNDTDRVRNNRDNDTDRVRNNRDNDTDRVRNNRDNRVRRNNDDDIFGIRRDSDDKLGGVRNTRDNRVRRNNDDDIFGIRRDSDNKIGGVRQNRNDSQSSIKNLISLLLQSFLQGNGQSNIQNQEETLLLLVVLMKASNS
jgi:hypothetical protein